MIYLLRHGQSEWNLLRRTQGQTGHPRLTALGRRQAALAAETVALHAGSVGSPVGSVVTSDLVRAAESARIVAHALKVPLRVDRRWREQGYGRLEGREYEATLAEIAAAPAGGGVETVGGEPARRVIERALAALGDLDISSATVVVTHGDTIRHLLRHLALMDLDDDVSRSLPNGSVIAVDLVTNAACRVMALLPSFLVHPGGLVPDVQGGEQHLRREASAHPFSGAQPEIQ